MTIFKKILVGVLTAGVLVTAAVGLSACGENNEEVKDTAPTTEIVTTVAPTTVKPTVKPTIEPTTVPVQTEAEAPQSSEEQNDDTDEEAGSYSYFSNLDDNDTNNVDTNSSNGVNNSSSGGAIYSPSDFQNAGVISWGGYDWTYYSELILSGEGLDIPGRHTTEDGYVCDGDGYVVLAADLSMLSRYSIIETPFGRTGKVYDTGCAYGVLDVYVGW